MKPQGVMVLVVLLIFGFVHPTPAQPAGQAVGPRCVVDPDWPQKPDDFQWAAMPGIAIDAQDQIYLFTRSKPAVQVYRPDGSLVRTWEVDGFEGAHFIRIDRDGNIWTTDVKRHLVQKHSPDGKLLLTLGKADQPGTEPGLFNKPTDTVLLPSGDLFISDGYGNRRVVHYDRNGRFVKAWGESGDQPGQFALPHSIAADSKNRLYVADRENARIQVFNTDGEVLAVWDHLITPWGLYITKDDEIWVSGSSPLRQDQQGWLVIPPGDQVVLKLNTKGEVLERHKLPKNEEGTGQPGETNWVHGIAVDSQGNLYLGDIQGQRAQKFRRVGG